MNVLVDNVLCEFDSQGYKKGPDVTGRIARVAWHHTVADHVNSGENFKVIGGGHVYIINYNEKTYKPQYALTFDQYLELKKEGKRYI